MNQIHILIFVYTNIRVMYLILVQVAQDHEMIICDDNLLLDI